MPGNKTGGLAAAKTNIEKHGPDFYKRIGALGGAKGRTGGFAASRELAQRAGKLGGSKSSRKGIKHGEGKTHKRPVVAAPEAYDITPDYYQELYETVNNVQ